MQRRFFSSQLSACARSSRQIINSADGGAMIEAVIIFPLLVLLLFGMIQYSLIFGAQLALKEAAIAGARAATLQSADADYTKQIIRKAAEPALDSSRIEAAVSDVTVDGEAARQVDLTYPFSIFFLQALPGAASGEITLSASATRLLAIINLSSTASPESEPSESGSPEPDMGSIDPDFAAG